MKPKLGKHLEWHGNRIRVVVRVPDSLREKVGRGKLREVLDTRDPLEAEREKVDVIRRLKAELRGEKIAIVQKPLADEALTWRTSIQQANEGQDGSTREDVDRALDDRIDRVRAEHGHAAARTFASIATGVGTPLATLLDRWFAEKKFTIGYKEDIRRNVAKLEQWCNRTGTTPTVENIKRATAGRYIHDLYVETEANVTTANKDISCLNSYWRWMKKREGIRENPWSEQLLQETKSREAAESDDKRAFDDDEVRKLLGGIRLRREWEFSFIAALSGLRIHEIAGLRVKDCADGKIAVTKSKTPSGVRTIPAHPLLRGLIKQRCEGKKPNDYLFDLPDQKPTSKRDRSSPVSQAFTRERRRLGVEERANEKQRQSNVDFHSWRRWFIRCAANSLAKGAKGYTAWTIAEVVGHKVEDGTIEGVNLPLGMTMGRYAGAASWEAMAACVKAVALPKDTLVKRDDLVRHMPGGRRPSVKRRELLVAAE